MKVHIVEKHDIFYRKGRLLAEEAYRQAWNTEHLIDGNDYAVVVSRRGKVMGNMNLQLRSQEKLLKSEGFFGREHWSGYFQPSSTIAAEVSALSISQDIPNDLSRPVMMSLILGILSLCRLQNINLLVTVQHGFLIRILKQSLYLPFIRNEKIKIPQGELPDDDYWRQKELPGLYYVEPHHPKMAEACFSFFCYLNVLGINTVFSPRVVSQKPTYSAFYKSCQSQQMLLDLAV